MDTSGLWLRRDGLEDNLLCGQNPIISLHTNTMTEEEYFNNIIKPALINRVPGSKDVEVRIYRVVNKNHFCSDNAAS